MKMIYLLFLAPLLLLGSATMSDPYRSPSSSPWSELEAGTIVHLKTDLEVAEDLILPAGTRFVIENHQVLSPPSIAIMNLRLESCGREIASREVPLVILEETFGFEMARNCRIALYLELGEYYEESYFELEPR
jgi:hypothetical protein